MRRIVIDTNCLLAILPSRSPYHRVWTEFLANKLEMRDSPSVKKPSRVLRKRSEPLDLRSLATERTQESRARLPAGYQKKKSPLQLPPKGEGKERKEINMTTRRERAKTQKPQLNKQLEAMVEEQEPQKDQSIALKKSKKRQ